MNLIGAYTLFARDLQRMFRLPFQTLFTPWVSALLYIFIFGEVVGRRIQSIGGVNYIDFVLPGIVMMNILTSAFSHGSASLFFMRFVRHIDEILVAPLSYAEMILAMVAGAVVRALVVGLGVYAIALLFTSATIAHFWLFLFYAVVASIIFSFLGLLVGLWAEHFEHLAILTTFVITPLTFLGGMFNTVDMLPSALQPIVRLNPFFYFIDAMRFSMIGIGEANPAIGAALIAVLLIFLGALTWYLFKIGYKIRT